jgi:hypothetical protein
MRSAAVLLLLCATAHAQVEGDDEPAPAAVAPVGAPMVSDAAPMVPDASFRAVGTRVVIVRTRSGEVVGQILAVEPDTISMMLDVSRQVVTLARAEVLGLCLVTPPEQPQLIAPVAVEQARAPRPKARHVSIGLGIAPGLTIDADVGLFYAFGNVSLVFPAASSGELAGFSTGVGLNFPLGKDSGWKFEVFGYLAPARFGYNDWEEGLGVGIGVHYTHRSGFTLGFKAPILGYAFRGPVGYDDSPGNPVVNFYLASAIGLPLMNLGYRF